MRWIRRDAVLHGHIEESDHLSAFGQMACPACDSSFESVVLHLDDLAFADSLGIEALTTYCGELDGRAVGVTIGTSRPAFRRLLESGPLGGFVGHNRGDESGLGESYTCPHR